MSRGKRFESARRLSICRDLQVKRKVRRSSRASPYRNLSAMGFPELPSTASPDILEKVKVRIHRLHLIRMSCRALDNLGMLALCAEARRERVAQRES